MTSLEGWLVGWIAVGLWIVAVAAQRRGYQLDLTGPAFAWPAVALSASHFVVSYRLAYSGPRASWRTRPVSLVVIPCALIAVAALAGAVGVVWQPKSVDGVTTLLMSLVLLTSGFHYVKQAYGVVLLAASSAGIRPAPREVRVLRFATYPLWLVDLQGGPWMSAVPGWWQFGISRSLKVLAVSSIIVLTSTLLRMSWRTRILPPGAMVAPYAAAALWMVFPIGLLGGAMVLAALHAVQYLVCCFRAEICRPERRKALAHPITDSLDDIRHFVMVLGACAAAGLLLVNSLPNLLGRHLAGGSTARLIPTLFFVVLNLSHYVIDATIWRSDGALLQSMRKRA